jgi:hypothetical protein
VAVLGAITVLAATALVIAHRPGQAVLYDSSDAPIPLMGTSVLSASDLAADTADFGHMPIVRVYYPGLPPPDAWTAGLAGANHSAVIVSFKAPPAAILSGADDAVLGHFFDTAPAGYPIYYSYYHEPEEHIADGQFTLADYKAAWAKVVRLADAAHNPYLHSTLILMEWDLQKASGRNWKSYLPGGGIISTLGWDAYPQGSATDQDPQLTPPQNFMAPAIAASRSVGLPYGFAEFALATPVGRAAWLTSVGNYLLTSGALFASYFNGNPEYPTERLTSAADIAVWRSFVQRSAAGRAPGPPSPPSPSPSPRPTAPAGLRIRHLALTPAVIGGGHTAISFTLTRAADVTICVLGPDGSVLRLLSRPARAAGPVIIPYYGQGNDGRRLPAGRYPVLVVASNAGGSTTAEATLTIGS